MYLSFSNQIKLVSYVINGDLLDSIENTSEKIERENIQSNVFDVLFFFIVVESYYNGRESFQVVGCAIYKYPLVCFTDLFLNSSESC